MIVQEKYKQCGESFEIESIKEEKKEKKSFDHGVPKHVTEKHVTENK